VVADNDLQADLAEIDENLCRAELTPAQTAAAVARRKEIYLALHPETAAGKSQAKGMNVKLGRGDVSEKCSPTFTKATAAASAMNRRSVEKAAARGQSIKPETLERIAGTSLDKGVELDALAKIPADQRDELIEKAVKGEIVSARPLLKNEPTMAPDLGPPQTPSKCASDDEDNQLRNLEAAWNAASDGVRVAFGFEVLGLGARAYSLPKKGKRPDTTLTHQHNDSSRCHQPRVVGQQHDGVEHVQSHDGSQAVVGAVAQR
jgi:hypothetical protein